MRLRVCRLVAAMVAVVLAGALQIASASAGGRHPLLAPRFAQRCADRNSSVRNRANPLELPQTPPSSDPLGGAHFFVDGPAHGSAAGAIAQLLGIDTSAPEGSALPSFKDSESWATFAQYVTGRLGSVSAGTAHQIRELEKIASEPETQRVSVFSAGGTPMGMFDQTQKLFCDNFAADPGTVPVIDTSFLHGKLGGCPSGGQIAAYRPEFQSQISAVAQAIQNRPVALLLEVDAIGSSSCIVKHGGIGQWESLLNYEATTFAALPHTVVYLEGGYSDSDTAAYAARLLNASGVRKIQGFFTNGTHLNWTINEIKYGQAISRLTGGAHFIVNTGANGRGPDLNPHPVSQGIQDLCNPPGRGLGPRPTTSTGATGVDAFLWISVPGNSSGCGGGPPGATFWVARAVGLAERANGRLGPKLPSAPY